MPAANAETTERTKAPTVSDQIADAVRHAAHLSHEARLATSMATDVAEESVYAAKRALGRAKRRGVEALEDLRENAAHRVKRQPFRALGIAACIGVLVGVTVGAIANLGRGRSRKAGGG